MYDLAGVVAMYSTTGAVVVVTAAAGAAYETAGAGVMYSTTGALETVGAGVLYSTTGAGAMYSITGAGAMYSIIGAGPMYCTIGAGAMYCTTGAGAMYCTIGAGAMYWTIGAGAMYSTTYAGVMYSWPDRPNFKKHNSVWSKTGSVDTPFPLSLPDKAERPNASEQHCGFKDGKYRHTFHTVSTKAQLANSAGSKTGSVDIPFPTVWSINGKCRHTTFCGEGEDVVGVHTLLSGVVQVCHELLVSKEKEKEEEQGRQEVKRDGQREENTRTHRIPAAFEVWYLHLSHCLVSSWPDWPTWKGPHIQTTTIGTGALCTAGAGAAYDTLQTDSRALSNGGWDSNLRSLGDVLSHWRWRDVLPHWR